MPLPDVPLASLAPPDVELPVAPEVSLLVPLVDASVPELVPVSSRVLLEEVPVPAEVPEPLLMLLPDVDGGVEVVCAKLALLAPRRETNIANGSFFILPPVT